MTGIDSRVVTMKFDNAAFERGVATTMGTMSKLKSALVFPGATKGLDAIKNASSGFNLNPLVDSTSRVSAGFIALGTIAVTALSRITSSALETAGSFLKQFSGLEAAQDGFSEYETKLGSIQTILANTDGENLRDVSKALGQLNTYSDKTIYNFGEMAKNIGTFTAAGVGLDESVQSIKGIANLAALSGSSSQQASTAMYQLSQAIAAGRVSLMDWNSVVNAGMGGKVFQTALANTAAAMGKIDDNAVKVEKSTGRILINGKSFRESISGGDSWLTSDILTNTLAQFSGDLSDAALRQQGFNAKQIKDIRATAKEASDAATKVKTFTQLIGTLKETMGSGWARTWELIFGNFNQARELFTGVNDTLSGFINASSKARNHVLKDWQTMGGRSAVIEGIRQLFVSFTRILKPIRNAFRDVFPAITGQRLAEMSIQFKRFTDKLRVNRELMANIRSIFHAVFAVFGFGIDVIKGLLHYVFSLFGLLSGGTGGVLDLVAAVADLVSKLFDWIKAGDLVDRFFDTIIAGRAAVFKPIIAFIGTVLHLLADLIRLGSGNLFDWIKTLDFGPVADILSNVKDAVGGFFTDLGGKLSGIDVSLEGFKGTFIAVFDAIKDAISNVDIFGFFDGIGGAADTAGLGFAGMQAGLIETPSLLERVANAIKNVFSFFGKLGSGLGGIGGGILDFFIGIKDAIFRVFSGLTFEQIISLIHAVLAGALIKTLSDFGKSIDKVFKSAGGVLDQVTANLKTMQTEVKANIILKIAGAIALLAVSIAILSQLDVDKIGIALGAITIMMSQLVIGMKLLEKSLPDNPLDAIKQAASMAILAGGVVALALAMVLMTAAVAILGNMDISTLGKGLGAIAAILLVVSGFVGTLNKAGGATGMVAAAFSIGLLAVALTALAGVIKLFSAMDGSTIAEGLFFIGASLVAIGVGMNALPPDMIALVLPLLGVSAALVILAIAMKKFGEMDRSEIVHSLIALGGAMLIIAVGLTAMDAAIPGAIAMVIFAGALAIMIGPLERFSKMGVWGIIKMFVALAGVFLLFAAASVVLIEAVPFMIAFGAALVLMGVGLLAAGAGTYLFAAGLALLAKSGPDAIAAVGEAILTFLKILPTLVYEFGNTLTAMVIIIGNASVELIKAFGKILKELFKVIIENAPQFGEALTAMIIAGLKVVRNVTPDLIKTGLFVLTEFIKGLADNVDDIGKAVTKLLVAFFDSFTEERMKKVVNAAFKTVIRFIKAMADAIEANSVALGNAGAQLLEAVFDGMGNVVDAFVSKIVHDVTSKLTSALDAIPGISIKPGLVATNPGDVSVPDKVPTHHQGDLTPSGPEPHGPGGQGKQIARSLGDINPTVTPVLDLDQLSKDANKMSDILTSQPVAEVSLSSAKEISSDQQAASEVAANTPAEVKEISFVQNNTSPKALSSLEIYRNTRSQFALAKEAL